MRVFMVIVVAFCSIVMVLPAAAEEGMSRKIIGKFEGSLVTRWAENGREMTLEQNFGFIDSKAEKWAVPKGATVDGGVDSPRHVEHCWKSLCGPISPRIGHSRLLLRNQNEDVG